MKSGAALVDGSPPDVQVQGPVAADWAIKSEHLGKKYRIHHEQGQRYTALRDVVMARATRLFREPQTAIRASEDFWGLKDVSFQVRQGEVVGIIGRNGAGKSTLLKVLSRITEPTEGRVRLRGRVASLLEVGTGFHPELTGRENIFLNGAILGMTRAEIRNKFDEIIAFAEVEKFLETPVKRYSSGMYVRLAFAVAAHLEPEVLIVDEVLAVGDAEFQSKCLGKMRDVSKGGRTVLFVSHNLAAVQSLCKRGIVLDHGRLIFNGTAGDAVARYLECGPTSMGSVGVRSLSQSISITRLQATPIVVPQHGRTVICLELTANDDELITDLALLIHTAGGERAALIDLRSSAGPYRLRSGQRLAVTTEIVDIPFVEADFNIGLYLSAESVCTSVMNLVSITVLPAETMEGPIPRDARFRGFVELRTRVKHLVSS